MIDLHTHVLPGIDDGARDDDQALAMLRIAAEEGSTQVVATPHAHHAVRHGVDIRAAVQRLNGLAAEASIPIIVLPGSEVRIASGLAERVATGELLTLNGSRYLLLELALHDEWPLPLVEGVLDKLLATGVVPVLAHAERYPFVQRDPASLQHFTRRGIPIQINARALLYRASDRERVTSERLLGLRLAHLLASDAHNDGYRAPRLRAAYERTIELAGRNHVERMLCVAEKIIANAPIRLVDAC